MIIGKLWARGSILSHSGASRLSGSDPISAGLVSSIRGTGISRSGHWITQRLGEKKGEERTLVSFSTSDSKAETARSRGCHSVQKGGEREQVSSVQHSFSFAEEFLDELIS
ncbi:hypothetical protein HRR82_004988, partial [Exophiala dermatitidis]